MQNRMKVHMFAAGILLAAAVVLAGCGRESRSQQSAQAVTSDLISDETEPDSGAQDSVKEDTGGEEPVDYTGGTQDLTVNDREVSTQFYTLTVPEEWIGQVTYRYYQLPENGEYRLEIFENTSAVATDGLGGRVAAILLKTSYGEETGLRSTEYLGRLHSENGSFFYVLLENPTQEQFTEGSRTAYDGIRLGTQSMKSRIEGRDGYSFETGSVPEENEETEPDKE